MTKAHRSDPKKRHLLFLILLITLFTLPATAATPVRGTLQATNPVIWRPGRHGSALTPEKNRAGQGTVHPGERGAAPPEWHRGYPQLQPGPDRHDKYARPCQQEAGCRQEPVPEKPSRKTKE